MKIDQKKVSEDLIKDVKSAVEAVAKKYDHLFEVKETDEGTDRVSNCTLTLTSKKWKKGSAIKFSVDRYSEYLGEPDDPSYFGRCDMGILLDKNNMEGWAGSKYKYNTFSRKEYNVGKFIKEIFLPISIEILNYQKEHKTINMMAFRDTYKAMWKEMITKTPSKEKIYSLLGDKELYESDSGSSNYTVEDFVSSYDDINKDQEIMKFFIRGWNPNDYDYPVEEPLYIVSSEETNTQKLSSIFNKTRCSEEVIDMVSLTNAKGLSFNAQSWDEDYIMEEFDNEEDAKELLNSKIVGVIKNGVKWSYTADELLDDRFSQWVTVGEDTSGETEYGTILIVDFPASKFKKQLLSFDIPESKFN